LDYSPTNGRLATLSGGALQAPSLSTFNYNYTANSNLLATVTGPAHTVTNDYDPDRNVLLTKSNTKATDNTVISSVNYIVNTLGQRTKRTTSDAATSVVTDWTYDTLGQVTSEDQPGTTTDRAYQYDHIGNRKKSANSLTLPATDNYTSNALNQYTAFTSGQLTSEPQYDFDGNMTAGPHPADPTIPALFFYDAENRLLEIRNATTGVTLQRNHYDAFHRLIRVTALHNGQSTTEHILWNGWTLVSRFVSNGNSLSETFHYTWGTDLSGSEQGAGGVGGLLAITRVPATGNASTRYPLYDGNGNITALVAVNGNLSASYRYDAFGKTLNSTDNDATGWVNHNIHGFSTKPTFGHQGLHYYGYRWYNAKDGRWINRDPIEENGGLNLYGFVYNNYSSWYDYLGMNPNRRDERNRERERRERERESARQAQKMRKACQQKLSDKAGEIDSKLAPCTITIFIGHGTTKDDKHPQVDAKLNEIADLIEELGDDFPVDWPSAWGGVSCFGDRLNDEFSEACPNNCIPKLGSAVGAHQDELGFLYCDTIKKAAIDAAKLAEAHAKSLCATSCCDEISIKFTFTDERAKRCVGDAVTAKNISCKK
jgi:RHS repeat-associated protein